MPMLDVLRVVRSLEGQIAITDPVEIRNPATFLIIPDHAQSITTVQAAFENRIAANAGANADEQRLGDVREDSKTVKVRFTAYDASYERACEIAVAFYDATWATFDAERPVGRRLGQTVDYLTMRGSESEIPSDFGGRPGFEIYLDVVVFERSP